MDHEYIYLYESDITAQLLKALTNPKSATEDIEGPVIRQRKISFKPYYTFNDRLTAELVAPSYAYLNNIAVGVEPDEVGTKRRRQCEEQSSGLYKVPRR